MCQVDARENREDAEQNIEDKSKVKKSKEKEVGDGDSKNRENQVEREGRAKKKCNMLHLTNKCYKYLLNHPN